VPQVITDVRPGWAVPGGRIAIRGTHLPLPQVGKPHVLVGGAEALVVAASRTHVRFVVPPGLTGGSQPVRIEELPGETAFLEIAREFVTGVHHVDGPLFDASGRLYVTESGARGTRPSTPLFRVASDGTKSPLAVEVGNPTSLALAPDGTVYVSSRFDGHVYRIGAADRSELFASELGVATGLAFGPDGNLYVGDRSGTIFQVSPDRQVREFATLPASVAAFHLAFGPGGNLYVSAPTMASHDAVYRITPDRLVDTVSDRFGRPQGLAFDERGMLYVVDALAGRSGLCRLDVTSPGAQPELLLSAPALVGLAFDPAGGLVLASNETIWRLDVPLRPWSG
jgi:sugar lactone lactonase YvrE